MSISPQAAIIIPHYNDLPRLRTCLDALVVQAESQPVEIIVVDNGSPLDLEPLKAAYPSVRIVVEQAKGAAPARNRGVAETTAPWLFFIDSDCVASQTWIATALSVGGKDEVIGGQVTLFDETPRPRSGAEGFETVFGFPQKDYIERKHFSVTANLLTTRSVFENVGGFVAGMSEDYDWCQRAHKLGYQIRYVEALQVGHPTRSDWAALHRKWTRITAESFLQNGTGAGDRIRWMLRAAVVAVSGVAHGPKVLGHGALSSQERLSALGTLVRLRLLRAVWMLRQAISGKADIS